MEWIPTILLPLTGLVAFARKRPTGSFSPWDTGWSSPLSPSASEQTLSEHVEPFAPWLLVLIGAINLWKLIRRSQFVASAKRPVILQPFLLGMLLAAGFETSSQLSVFLLASHTSPLLLGAAFTLGMVLTDGLDGYLAASTQWRAVHGQLNAQVASQALGLIVVLFSFGLGGAELIGFDTDHFALPLGLMLFAFVITTRIWGRTNARLAVAEQILGRMGLCPIRN